MKQLKRYLIWLSAAILVVAACGKEPAGGEETPIVPDTPSSSSLTISGKVVDTEGKPFVGAVISDGTTVVATDENGCFKFDKDRYASFIQCSIPADAVITCGGTYNLPECHYQKVANGKKVYDFTYKRQPVETQWRLLGVGDVQVSSENHIERFRKETLADIRALLNTTEKLPTYAITLGDNVSNKWDLFDALSKVMGTCPVPLFSTIGNHDHEYVTGGQSDALARKKYEATYGPSSYSFNRGDCHIVSMDDVDHLASGSSNYGSGFEKWQYEWLKKDLSFVSKDKRIILCVHIPIVRGFSPKHEGVGYYNELFELLSQFKEAMIVSGHTHNINTAYNKTVNGKVISDYTLGAACGAWWTGTICVWGEPNGYDVFEFNGTELKNEYYKGTMLPMESQMWMMRSTDFPSFTNSDMSTTFSFPAVADDIIYVHAYNSRNWKFTLYEDGVATSTAPTSMSAYNMWAKTYFLNRGKIDSNNYTGKSGNMKQFRLKNKDAKDIKVTAEDNYGHTFTVSKFMTMENEPLNYETLLK